MKVLEENIDALYMYLNCLTDSIFEYIYCTGISETGNSTSHIGFIGKGCKGTRSVADCVRGNRYGTTIV